MGSTAQRIGGGPFSRVVPIVGGLLGADAAVDVIISGGSCPPADFARFEPDLGVRSTASGGSFVSSQ